MLELFPRETCSGRALTLLAIVAPTVLSCKLESTKNFTANKPQRYCASWAMINRQFESKVIPSSLTHCWQEKDLLSREE